VKRGDASVNGEGDRSEVNKQPQADTPTVTCAVEAAMAEVAGLSRDINVATTFRQKT